MPKYTPPGWYVVGAGNDARACIHASCLSRAHIVFLLLIITIIKTTVITSITVVETGVVFF